MTIDEFRKQFADPAGRARMGLNLTGDQAAAILADDVLIESWYRRVQLSLSQAASQSPSPVTVAPNVPSAQQSEVSTPQIEAPRHEPGSGGSAVVASPMHRPAVKGNRGGHIWWAIPTGVAALVLVLAIVGVLSVPAVNGSPVGAPATAGATGKAPAANNGPALKPTPAIPPVSGNITDDQKCTATFCELNVHFTNTSSTPQTLNGDVCVVAHGATFKSNESVSTALNPGDTTDVYVTFERQFSTGTYLGPVFVGDCGDQSTAQASIVTGITVASQSPAELVAANVVADNFTQHCIYSIAGTLHFVFSRWSNGNAVVSFSLDPSGYPLETTLTIVDSGATWSVSDAGDSPVENDPAVQTGGKHILCSAFTVNK
ncbi:hypothetical protein G3T36_02660 [Diaminobutyricibacter tongyongensis]|uniref:Uncharacterized protein n=1 Tax=Leifsonia tongyongensis TaxID=1268043 RepID=A0A6L9XTM2_9MICO|nr:hypothetical protein [Diaminobutyricibacter tongyongensis]NEN04762.1 hypothetical protein [Diaminobutyricibacter tongyongensis]